MSETTFEQVLSGAQLLLPEARTKLLEVLHTASGQPDFEEQVEGKFHRLAEQWMREMEHTSSVKKACMHPAYQRIIGMGPAVLPYLLRELERQPDHWFWALNAITEEDPAQSEASFEGALKAWLQ